MKWYLWLIGIVLIVEVVVVGYLAYKKYFLLNPKRANLSPIIIGSHPSIPSSPESKANRTPDLSEKLIYPAEIIDLTNWKITLPISKYIDQSDPLEIKQPELATYTINPWFIASTDDGVLFRAPVNGDTTSGSDYPRSELREMVNNGRDKAAWNSREGTHKMIVEEAVTAVPKKKRHVVTAQIHDSSDDVIVIRLDFPKLYINVDGKHVHTLDANYNLGERFTVQFVVNGGKTKVYYNNQSNPSYILDKNYSGAYFKAGAYTQSNCDKEGSSLCRDDNYGEVVIYKLAVTHK